MSVGPVLKPAIEHNNEYIYGSSQRGKQFLFMYKIMDYVLRGQVKKGKLRGLWHVKP